MNFYKFDLKKFEKTYSSKDWEVADYEDIRYGTHSLRIYGKASYNSPLIINVARTQKGKWKTFLYPAAVAAPTASLSRMLDSIPENPPLLYRCECGSTGWSLGECVSCAYVRFRLNSDEAKEGIMERGEYTPIQVKRFVRWDTGECLEGWKSWLSEPNPKMRVFPRYSFKGGSYIIDPFKMVSYGIRRIYCIGGMDAERYNTKPFNRKRFDILNKNVHVDWLSEADKESALALVS